MSSPQTVEHQTIYAAIAAIQQAIEPITKDNTATVTSKRTGKSFNYSYADLGTVLDSIMPVLAENGVAITQTTAVKDNGQFVLITSLYTTNGNGFVEGEYLIQAADMSDPQAVGSAVTYARRYAIIAMLCLSTEDDDGQKAQQSRSSTTQQQTERATTPTLRKTPPKMEIWHANVGTAQLVDDPNKRKAALATLGREAAQSAWPTTYATYLTESVGEDKFTGWVNGLIEEANAAAAKSPDVIEETPF